MSVLLCLRVCVYMGWYKRYHTNMLTQKPYRVADKSDSSRATFQLTNIDLTTSVAICISRRSNRWISDYTVAVAIALTRSQADATGSLHVAPATKQCRHKSLASGNSS